MVDKAIPRAENLVLISNQIPHPFSSFIYTGVAKGHGHWPSNACFVDPRVNDVWSLNLVYPPPHTHYVVASFTCGSLQVEGLLFFCRRNKVI